MRPQRGSLPEVQLRHGCFFCASAHQCRGGAARRSRCHWRHAVSGRAQPTIPFPGQATVTTFHPTCCHGDAHPIFMKCSFSSCTDASDACAFTTSDLFIVGSSVHSYCSAARNSLGDRRVLVSVCLCRLASVPLPRECKLVARWRLGFFGGAGPLVGHRRPGAARLLKQHGRCDGLRGLTRDRLCRPGTNRGDSWSEAPPPPAAWVGYLSAVWRFFWCREMDLELVRGANFSWRWMCGAGTGDLGDPGGRFRKKNRKTEPKNSSQIAFRHPVGAATSGGVSCEPPPLQDWARAAAAGLLGLRAMARRHLVDAGSIKRTPGSIKRIPGSV